MQQVIAILGDDNSDGSIKVEVMGEENLDLFPITARDELEQSFRIEKFEIESEDTSHTITLPDGINADDLLGAATVNQIKTKHDAKVVWPISFSTFFNHANILAIFIFFFQILLQRFEKENFQGFNLIGCSMNDKLYSQYV